MSASKTTTVERENLSRNLMTDSGSGIVEDQILGFFNEVDDPRDISEVLCDTASYSKSRLASQIIKTREKLSSARFASVDDIFSIPGFNNELRISVGRAFSELAKPVALRTRRGAHISGTWIYEISGLSLEIVEDEIADNILVRLPTGRYLAQKLSTFYNPLEDGFSLSAIPDKLANLVESPTPYSSLLINSPLIHLDRVSTNVLEISCNGKAFPLVRENSKALSLNSEEQNLYRLAYGDNELEDSYYENIPLSASNRPDEDFPLWWSQSDTRQFLRSLQPVVIKALDRRFSPDEDVSSEVLQRLLKKSALQLLTSIIAEKRVTKIRQTLIDSGKTHEQSIRLARRIGHRLEKDFLYKHLNLLRRFAALTELDSMRALLRSSQMEVRAEVIRFLVGALGKRVLSIPSLVDDMFSAGEDMLSWWKAQETWHGAREVWRQARKLEIVIDKFHRALSPEQQAQNARHYLRARQPFETLRELHMKFMEALIEEETKERG